MYKTAGQIAKDILVKIAAGGGTRLGRPSMFSLNAPQVPGRKLLDDSAYTTTGGRDLSAYNRPGGSAAATVPAASPAVSTAAAAPRKHWSEGTMGNLKAQIAAAGNDPRRLALVQKWNKGVDLSRYGVGTPSPAQKAAPVVAAGPKEPIKPTGQFFTPEVLTGSSKVPAASVANAVVTAAKPAAGMSQEARQAYWNKRKALGDRPSSGGEVMAAGMGTVNDRALARQRAWDTQAGGFTRQSLRYSPEQVAAEKAQKAQAASARAAYAATLYDRAQQGLAAQRSRGFGGYAGLN